MLLTPSAVVPGPREVAASVAGERPIEDLLVKEVCVNRADGLVTRVESRRYYKPGQFAVDPNENRLTENQFESSSRLEVYRPGKAAQEQP